MSWRNNTNASKVADFRKRLCRSGISPDIKRLKLAGGTPALHKMPAHHIAIPVKTKILSTTAMLIFLLSSCEKKPTYAEQRKIELAESIQKVADFHQRQRTDLEWFRAMDSGEAYTVEIQKALLSDDSPRLVIADLLDIAQSGEKIIASFEDFSMDSYFRLELTPAQAEEMLKTIPQQDRGSASFAIAFRAKSVNRPVLYIGAKAYEDDAEVELQSSQATIITGTCIAWEYLGTSAISMPDFIENQSK